MTTSQKQSFAITTLLLLIEALFSCSLVCFADNREERIHRKVELVEKTAQQWEKSGKNPTEALMIMKSASQAFDSGDVAKGENLIDQAMQTLGLNGTTPIRNTVHSFRSSTPSTNNAKNILNKTKTGAVFSNPEPVTIQGYTGPQEDPVISPDGNFLFFDSHDDTGKISHLYYAKRVDYKTFKFIGHLPGVNMNYPSVEGVEDSAHNFYFVSLFFLEKGGLTIGRGVFSKDGITNISPIKGISPKPAKPGSRALNCDIAITPNGKTLYFADFMINESNAQVETAQLAIATKNSDGSFTRGSDGADILKSINALGLLVHNATPSADGLELVFNASPGFPSPSHIYIATRQSLSAPFASPQVITAADLEQGKLSEPGSFSPDGKYLYFHRVLSSSSSQLYVLSRHFVSTQEQMQNFRRKSPNASSKSEF